MVKQIARFGAEPVRLRRMATDAGSASPLIARSFFLLPVASRGVTVNATFSSDGRATNTMESFRSMSSSAVRAKHVDSTRQDAPVKSALYERELIPGPDSTNGKEEVP